MKKDDKVLLPPEVEAVLRAEDLIFAGFMKLGSSTQERRPMPAIYAAYAQDNPPKYCLKIYHFERDQTLYLRVIIYQIKVLL